jgi:hypothetical protein
MVPTPLGNICKVSIAVVESECFDGVSVKVEGDGGLKERLDTLGV